MDGLALRMHHSTIFAGIFFGVALWRRLHSMEGGFALKSG